MKRENTIGNLINFSLVGLAFYIMILGGLKFLIVSAAFYALGGLFEFIIMAKFHSKKEKPVKKISKYEKIKNGFLWVHGITYFINANDTTIYDFKKLGYLPSITAYLIMGLYVLIAFFLFRIFSYWGFTIYMIPIITNLIISFKYHYFIYSQS